MPKGLVITPGSESLQGHNRWGVSGGWASALGGRVLKAPKAPSTKQVADRKVSVYLGKGVCPGKGKRAVQVPEKEYALGTAMPRLAASPLSAQVI